MATTKRILILGSVPLPIGGVTVHVSRLLAHLGNTGYPFYFVHLHQRSKWYIVWAILHFRWVHLNTSNARLMYLCAFLCKWAGKKLIITYHGNFGRKKGKEAVWEQKAIQWSYLPLFLNPISLQEGLKLNPKARQISAFIPPNAAEPLPALLETAVQQFVAAHRVVFCTNAFNVSIDVNGHETYGISGLLKVMSHLTDKGLIFSDPTGNYKQFLLNKGIAIPENVLILTEPHDFVQIIQRSHAFIRATTTDGDSLSVKEALYEGTAVIASDCVARHPACTVYPVHDWAALGALLSTFQPQRIEVELSNGAEEIASIYRSL